MKSGVLKGLGILVVLLLCYGVMQGCVSSKHLCQITFVPIGNFPSTSLQALASYYEQTLGLHIVVRPAIPFEESMMDRSRGQLIGEELVNGMKTGYPTQAQDRSVMMVGFDLPGQIRSRVNDRLDRNQGGHGHAQETVYA
jgi:hypothetical protein